MLFSAVKHIEEKTTKKKNMKEKTFSNLFIK